MIAPLSLKQLLRVEGPLLSDDEVLWNGEVGGPFSPLSDIIIINRLMLLQSPFKTFHTFCVPPSSRKNLKSGIFNFDNDYD